MSDSGAIALLARFRDAGWLGFLGSPLSARVISETDRINKTRGLIGTTPISPRLCLRAFSRQHIGICFFSRRSTDTET